MDKLTPAQAALQARLGLKPPPAAAPPAPEISPRAQALLDQNERLADAKLADDIAKATRDTAKLLQEVERERGALAAMAARSSQPAHPSFEGMGGWALIEGEWRRIDETAGGDIEPPERWDEGHPVPPGEDLTRPGMTPDIAEVNRKARLAAEAAKAAAPPAEHVDPPMAADEVRPPDAPKRRRRTKAEMEADKLAEARELLGASAPPDPRTHVSGVPSPFGIDGAPTARTQVDPPERERIVEGPLVTATAEPLAFEAVTYLQPPSGMALLVLYPDGAAVRHVVLAVALSARGAVRYISLAPQGLPTALIEGSGMAIVDDKGKVWPSQRDWLASVKPAPEPAPVVEGEATDPGEDERLRRILEGDAGAL